MQLGREDCGRTYGRSSRRNPLEALGVDLLNRFDLKRIAVSALLFGFVTVSSPVSACSCPGVSHWGFLVPQTGRLPANAIGVAFYSPWSAYTIDEILGKVSVEIKEDDRFRAVPAAAKPVPDFEGVYVVGPKDGLEAGRIYRFTDLNESSLRADEAPLSVVVTVDHATLDATTPFAAEVHPLPPRAEWVAAGGLCARERRVSRTRVITLLPEAPPEWLHQLLYVTLVDGDKQWIGRKDICHRVPPGRSRIQTGWSLLYADCHRPFRTWPPEFDYVKPMLSATPHTVQVRAFLPGTDIVLETQTVAVDLSCPAD